MFRPSRTAEREVREATQPDVYRLAKALADRAGQLAPDGDRLHHKNRDSYKVRVRRTPDGPQTTVDSTDHQAGHIVEFGSVTSPEYAPLRRAIRELGLDFVDFGRSKGASGRQRGPSRDTRTKGV